MMKTKTKTMMDGLMTKNSKEYENGKQAFKDKKDVDSNPYEKDYDRIEWFKGWYNERTNQFVGKILKKYGQKWE